MSVVNSPAGLVYATWRNSATGAGGVEEAVYFPDGMPMVLPTLLPGSAVPTYAPTGGPSILIDSFQRPLIAWPSSNPSGSFVSVTGDFLSANQSLAMLNMVLTDPLTGGDFSSPGSESAFSSSTAFSSTSISGSLSSNSLAKAQNTTALGLYPELTHIPLEVISGSGTTTGSLVPKSQPSPIVNSSGVDAPNVYLAVYADWLLESEAVPLVPDIFGNATVGMPISTPIVNPKADAACALVSGPSCLGGLPDDLQVMSTVGTTGYSPTSFVIDPSALLWREQNLNLTYKFTQTCGSDGAPINNTPSTFHIVIQAAATWMNVSIDSGTVHAYEGTGSQFPWVYVTNLTPDTRYTYSVSLNVTYSEVISGNWCSQAGQEPEWNFTTQHPHLGPTFVGAVTTELSFESPQMSVGFPSSGNGPSTVNFAWGSYLPATAKVQVKDLNSSKVWSWSNYSYASATTGALAFVGTLGHYYEVTFTATSRAGGWTSIQLPALAGGTHGTSTAQTATQIYGGPGSKYPIIDNAGIPVVRIWALETTNITGTTALVSWTSNVNSSGYATYSVNGSSVAQSLFGLRGTVLSNGSAWDYVAQLHGLEPWTTYLGTIGILYVVSNWTQNVSEKMPAFTTSPVESVWEQDLPYDSISNTGGGAAIRWDVSASFTKQNPGAEVIGGTIWIWNATGNEVIPVSPSELNSNSASPWFNCLNITLAGFNQTYGFILQLNYSTTPETTATSAPTYFTYQADSSGDGLTNLEKVNGWYVTNPYYPNLDEWVQPFVSAYSTNGLSNDFIEKEYDLNPQTLDTENSDMLDLWNLTFDLGANSSNPAIPDSSLFHLWWETNTSFNPFNYAPYPGGSDFGLPLATDLNNISCTSTNCPGDSPYSAEVLWSSAALSTFLNLTGVWNLQYTYGTWLRAVLGTSGSERTLTIWGKLSWGANPEVASTPGSGLTDGSRLSPVGNEDLSIQVTNLYVQGLQTGQGYAARIGVYAGTTPTGTAELLNYTAPAGLTAGSGARLTGYTTVVPVSQTSQYETLQIEVLANESGSKTLTSIAFAYVHSKIYFEENVTYDMVLRQAVSYSYSISNALARPNGSLAFTLQSVPVGGKVPTFLWLPTDNSTVNGLPAGLERYTGEQSFDLVVVNASSAISSVSIPYPWGGTYRVSLQTGLNNFLFPREQFLNSSFAAAVFEGKKFPYPTNLPTPPVVASDVPAQDLLTQSFGTTSGLMLDLQAYWQNRSISAPPGNFTSAETGVPGSSSLQVRTMVVQSAPSNNTGGLPSEPGLFANASLPSPPALQAIVTLNITSTQTLDLLLSALLTNTTAGVNGTFQSITNQVPSFGLAPAVLSALANAPIVSQGVYGPPPYKPSSSPSGGPWGEFWNAVSAVLTNPLGAIESLVGVVWSGTVASFTYLNHLFQEALAAGGNLLARGAATLVSVGKAILNGLEQLLNYIYALVKELFSPIVGAVDSSMQSYDASLAAPLKQAWASENGSGAVTSAEVNSIGLAFGGPALELGLGIGVAVTIALTLLTPFDLGPSFVIGMVIGLIAGALLSSGFVISAASTLSSSAVFAIENLANRTVDLPVSEWATLAGVLGIVAAGAEVPFSWYLLSQALNFKNAPADELFSDAAAITAIALAAIFIGALAVPSGDSILLLFSFVLATLSLAAISIHYFTNDFIQSNPGLRQLAYVDVGLSAGAMAGSLADFGGSLNKL